MQKGQPERKVRPAQTISQASKGKERKMDPEPVYERPKVFKRLEGKTAIVTGGDSGIGRAVAVAFAQEGAEVVIPYFSDDIDANDTAARIADWGGSCVLVEGDVSNEAHCRNIVEKTIETYGKIDIVVNNAAVQTPHDKLEEITAEQIQRTFEVNVFSHLYMVKAAEKYLTAGASIIHSTSVTAYRGSAHLLDYAATKGAIVSLVRSLASYFADKQIRVNGVAPGPVWTPLIPTTFSAKEVSKFGSETPLGRAADPVEIAPAYVFLASDDASYITGQVIHPNGGEIVNT